MCTKVGPLLPPLVQVATIGTRTQHECRAERNGVAIVAGSKVMDSPDSVYRSSRKKTGEEN
jgi:hypothetical protein